MSNKDDEFIEFKVYASGEWIAIRPKDIKCFGAGWYDEDKRSSLCPNCEQKRFTFNYIKLYSGEVYQIQKNLEWLKEKLCQQKAT